MINTGFFRNAHDRTRPNALSRGVLDGKPRSATDANEDTYDSAETHEVVNFKTDYTTVEIVPELLLLLTDTFGNLHIE